MKESKTAQWERVRRTILKPRFQKWGITRCEATWPHECWGETSLGFAHSKKRNDIVGDEIEEVALLCVVAHQQVDAHKKPETYRIIREIISNRCPEYAT